MCKCSRVPFHSYIVACVCRGNIHHYPYVFHGLSHLLVAVWMPVAALWPFKLIGFGLAGLKAQDQTPSGRTYCDLYHP